MLIQAKKIGPSPFRKYISLQVHHHLHSMRNLLHQTTVTAILLAALQSCSSPQSTAAKTEKDSTAFYTANDFTTIKKTDAHVHVQVTDSAFIKQAIDDNVDLFSIDYDDVNEPPPMEVQEKYALFLQKNFPERFQYATTISVRKFNDDDWTTQNISYIRNSLLKGAKAVKIYKVIGMSLRDNRASL